MKVKLYKIKLFPFFIKINLFEARKFTLVRIESLKSSFLKCNRNNFSLLVRGVKSK
jgi:hypothetical protein